MKYSKKLSQTTFKNAKVIRYFGKWSLEVFSGGLVASDGWKTVYPIIYPHNMKVAWDSFPPLSVIEYVNKNAERLLKEVTK
jgi:hypothetical protein